MGFSCPLFMVEDVSFTEENHRHSRREEFVHEAACVGEGNTEPFVIFKIHEQSLENDCHSLTRVPFEGFFGRSIQIRCVKALKIDFLNQLLPMSDVVLQLLV